MTRMQLTELAKAAQEVNRIAERVVDDSSDLPDGAALLIATQSASLTALVGIAEMMLQLAEQLVPQKKEDRRHLN